MVDTPYLSCSHTITLFLGNEGIMGFHIIKKAKKLTLNTQDGLIYDIFRSAIKYIIFDPSSTYFLIN